MIKGGRGVKCGGGVLCGRGVTKGGIMWEGVIMWGVVTFFRCFKKNWGGWGGIHLAQTDRQTDQQTGQNNMSPTTIGVIMWGAARGISCGWVIIRCLKTPWGMGGGYDVLSSDNHLVDGPTDRPT
ncbi:hypothetical protein DPMN_120425 [Dreissena polymorpha]|uniref:Uncharacterized protein n=1 Tax=Dreissena polymorpha TaxID=45954 RepID=A0A9D4GRI7_DREPO|nr:hypothetical protein DPMN_120425 [Dreissena polymorpha]